MTITNLLSVRAYGEVEFWFSLIKVSAIGAFIAIGAGFLGLFHWHDALHTCCPTASRGCSARCLWSSFP
jgi:L-asparagine transporter-like permease